MGYAFQEQFQGNRHTSVNFIPVVLKMKNIQGNGIEITFIQLSEYPVFELHFSSH